MDTLILQLLCGQLRVSGGCRMDDQALNVSNICQQRKDLQLVNELKCCFLSALDIEGEDGRLQDEEKGRCVHHSP